MSPAIRRRLTLARRACRSILAGLSLLAWPVLALELQPRGQPQAALSNSAPASRVAWRQPGRHDVAALDGSYAL